MATVQPLVILLSVVSIHVDAETPVRKVRKSVVSEQLAADGIAEVSDDHVSSTHPRNFVRDARHSGSLEVDAIGNFKIPDDLANVTSKRPLSLVPKTQVTADGAIKISDPHTDSMLKHERDTRKFEHVEGEHQETHRKPDTASHPEPPGSMLEAALSPPGGLCWKDKNALEDNQGQDLGMVVGSATLVGCKMACDLDPRCLSIAYNAIKMECAKKDKAVTPITPATLGEHQWFTYYKWDCNERAERPEPPWCADALNDEGCYACEKPGGRAGKLCQGHCIGSDCALRMGSSLPHSSAQAEATMSLLHVEANQIRESITPLKSDVGQAICGLCANKGALSQVDSEKCSNASFWPAGLLASPIQNANRRRGQNCFAVDYIEVGTEIEYEFGPRMNLTQAVSEIASVCSCIENYTTGSFSSVTLPAICSCPSICPEFKNVIGCNSVTRGSIAQTKANTSATTISRLGRSGRPTSKLVALLKKRLHFGQRSHARAQLTDRSHALLDNAEGRRVAKSRAGSNSVGKSKVTAEETLRGKCR